MFEKQDESVPWFEFITIYHDDPRVVVVRKLQRRLSLPKVKRYVANWNDEWVGTLEMDVLPDGTFHTTDGQHRHEAAKIVAKRQHRKVPLPVKLWHNRPHKSVGDTFIGINVGRGPVAANDLWPVRRETLDPVVLEIDRVLAEFGIEVIPSGSHSKRWDRTTSTSVLERIYKAGGSDLLRRTLAVAVAAFAGDKFAVNAYFMAAIAWVLHSFEDDPDYAGIFDRERLISRLREVSSDAIKRKTSEYIAKAGHHHSEACAHALVDFYNWKLRLRLDEKHLNERGLTW